MAKLMPSPVCLPTRNAVADAHLPPDGSASPLAAATLHRTAYLEPSYNSKRSAIDQVRSSKYGWCRGKGRAGDRWLFVCGQGEHWGGHIREAGLVLRLVCPVDIKRYYSLLYVSGRYCLGLSHLASVHPRNNAHYLFVVMPVVNPNNPSR